MVLERNALTTMVRHVHAKICENSGKEYIDAGTVEAALRQKPPSTSSDANRGQEPYAGDGRDVTPAGRRPMMADEPDLAMIGRIVLETREAMRRVEAKLDGLAAELGQVKDELMVVSGIVLRLEGREVETVGLKAL